MMPDVLADSPGDDNLSYVVDTNLSHPWYDPHGTALEGPDRVWSALGAAIMLAFLLEGLLGTIWILAAILSQRRLWNVINVFIISLGLNDLLTLCLVVALIIDSYMWRRWTGGETLCKLNPEFTVAFTGCSLWHTAFIAIHRYIVVVHNTKYKRMSKSAYVIFVLLMSRAIPMACTIPGLSLQSSGYVPKLLRCILLPTQKARMLSFTIVQIIIPCLVVFICYALVFAFVFYLGSHVHNNHLILQRELQITKMFGVIFLMILVGFVPYAIIRNMDRNNTYGGNVYVIVTVMYGIAACANPLVYGAMSTELRHACMDCLRGASAFFHCQRCFSCLSPRIQSDADMTTYAITDNNIKEQQPLNGSPADDLRDV